MPAHKRRYMYARPASGLATVRRDIAPSKWEPS